MNLQRFKDAQERRGSGFESALSEIQSGRKQGHWIWYVFPQLAGLGHSAASREFGIDDVREAEAYLRDPLLRGRLLTIVIAVDEQLRHRIALESLMNAPIDVMKLVSSLTLFSHVAKRLNAEEGLSDYASLARVSEAILAKADAQGYPPCQFTINRLR